MTNYDDVRLLDLDGIFGDLPDKESQRDQVAIRWSRKWDLLINKANPIFIEKLQELITNSYVYTYYELGELKWRKFRYRGVRRIDLSFEDKEHTDFDMVDWNDLYEVWRLYPREFANTLLYGYLINNDESDTYYEEIYNRSKTDSVIRNLILYRLEQMHSQWRNSLYPKYEDLKVDLLVPIPEVVKEIIEGWWSDGKKVLHPDDKSYKEIKYKVGDWREREFVVNFREDTGLIIHHESILEIRLIPNREYPVYEYDHQWWGDRDKDGYKITSRSKRQYQWKYPPDLNKLRGGITTILKIVDELYEDHYIPENRYRPISVENPLPVGRLRERGSDGVMLAYGMDYPYLRPGESDEVLTELLQLGKIIDKDDNPTVGELDEYRKTVDYVNLQDDVEGSRIQYINGFDRIMIGRVWMWCHNITDLMEMVRVLSEQVEHTLIEAILYEPSSPTSMGVTSKIYLNGEERKDTTVERNEDMEREDWLIRLGAVHKAHHQDVIDQYIKNSRDKIGRASLKNTRDLNHNTNEIFKTGLEGQPIKYTSQWLKWKKGW